MTAVGYVDLLIRAAGPDSSVPASRTRKSPASRPAPASATSSWTTPPTRPRRWTSSRTPRPAAPASATPRKSASSTAPLPSEIPAEAGPAPRPRPHRQGSTPGGTAAGRARCRSHPRHPAGPKDFDTEFLDYILAVKIVDSVEEAIAHIAAHSTGHSEAILTRTDAHAALFTAAVDSAAVYVNCSTRFTDGGEFGLGCEMGISTQKLHARGPWASASCAAISTSSTATVRPGNFRVFSGCITLSVKIFSTGGPNAPACIFVSSRWTVFLSSTLLVEKFLQIHPRIISCIQIFSILYKAIVILLPLCSTKITTNLLTDGPSAG